MPNDVLMDYDAIENLIQYVNKVGEELNNLIQACEKAAVKIESEGLVNRQGQQWAEQLRSEISPYLQRQVGVYEELAQDLQGALDDLQSGDVQARSRFS
jgi:prefoldin subunit 5